MIERPSLHALSLFLAVVEHGTMTAAAKAEGISQPAISAQVKALERYYGTPLLQRGGRARPHCRRAADRRVCQAHPGPGQRARSGGGRSEWAGRR